MARRRWIYTPTEVIEVTGDYEPPTQDLAKNHVFGDRHYDGLRSPIDGANISTRARHREYMKANGLATADDFKGVWANAAKEREKIVQGVDPTRVRDVVDAVQKVQRGHRPKRIESYD